MGAIRPPDPFGSRSAVAALALLFASFAILILRNGLQSTLLEVRRGSKAHPTERSA